MSTIKRRDFIRNTAGGVTSTALASSFIQHTLASSSSVAKDTAPPKRLVIWHVPEGCAQQAFWPVKTGDISINDNADITGRNPRSNFGSIRGYVDPSMAGYCLQPLKKHIDDFSLYSGFQNLRDSTQSDQHVAALNSALTGGTADGGSLDQIVGQAIQGSSFSPSIYTPVYGHHVQNRGAAYRFMSPARRIGGGTFGSSNWNPIDTYKELFPNGIPGPRSPDDMTSYHEQTNARLAILKSIEARLEEAQCQGSEQTAAQLDVMLKSYREIETRTQGVLDSENGVINADVRFDIPQGWLDNIGNRTDLSKYWNDSRNFEQLMDIATNTTLAAFALDRTRVSLLQFSATGDNKGPVKGDHYQHIKDIEGLESSNASDHFLSFDPDPVKRRDQARVFRWYYKKLADFIDRLKSVPEGDGTLFDNTMIVTVSDFAMHSNRSHDMPYMVFGGSNINFKKGVYLNVSTGNEFRDAADFFLGVSQLVAPGIKTFGTSSQAYSL